MTRDCRKPQMCCTCENLTPNPTAVAAIVVKVSGCVLAFHTVPGHVILIIDYRDDHRIGYLAT